MITLVICRGNTKTKYPLAIDIDAVENKFGILIHSTAINLSNVLTIDLNTSDFSTAIYNLRVTAGFSQVELSKKSDLTSQYISQVENGKKIPKDSTILKLLNALLIQSINTPSKDITTDQEKVSYNSNANNDDIPFARIRRSEKDMKISKFKKYRKNIRDEIDNILYDADEYMIKALDNIVGKLRDYNFSYNATDSVSPEEYKYYKNRCEKYIDDISSELDDMLYNHIDID